MILSDSVYVKYISAGTKKEMYKWEIAVCWGCRTRGDFYFSNFYLIWLYCFFNNSFTKI